MSDSSGTDAFVGAVNFCTGSQTDYSTCIANNMRFTPYLDDTYEASGFAGLNIKTQDLPLIYGDVFVDLKPLAIANIFARIKMTNSYGGVSFRCSDVFNRPRLPLPRLQDLGIPAQDIVNVIGIDPIEAEDPLTFEGVPITADDSVIGWMFNYINLLIGYTSAVSDTMTKGREIKGTILGMLDYYALPGLSEEMDTSSARSLNIYNEAVMYMNKVLNDATASSQLKSNVNEIKYYASAGENYMSSMRVDIVNNIVNPLSIINENTDFTTFDFTITEGVVEVIIAQERDKYPFIFSYSMQAKNTSGVYGIPPMYPNDSVVVAKKVVDIFSAVLRNTISASLTSIAGLYSVSAGMEDALDSLRADEIFVNSLKARKAYFTSEAKAYIQGTGTDDEAGYLAVIDQMVVLLNTFSYGTLMDDIEAIEDGDLCLLRAEEDHDTEIERCVEDRDFAIAACNGDAPCIAIAEEEYESCIAVALAEYNIAKEICLLLNDAKNKIIDDYYTSIGNVSNIELYNLSTKQNDLYNTTTGITEVFLGADYKDAGKFYYADLAYAVGYAKLRDIKSIQINDEFYELTEIVDENGNPVNGISESGCTKYTFQRHVLPTYIVEVEMYIYPGTPDQPYCPTINRYHNFLTSKYSGVFTKMDGEDMGIYIFKGYKPMVATVEEVIQVGAMDLNAINLNDPSLDQKSYEAMLMKEIKNLTNASSIGGEPLSTEDFKYYMSSTIVDDTVASNYPGLAIIEFKNFPLGANTGFPKIKVNVVGEDLL